MARNFISIVANILLAVNFVKIISCIQILVLLADPKVNPRNFDKGKIDKKKFKQHRN